MAYVPRQLPEDQENQFGRTELTTPFPTPAGGGSAGSGQAPGVGTSTEFGSNAAKLSDYLKANQEQVAEYGQQVAGDLTQRYNKTLGDLDTGLNQFSQEAQSGYTPPDQTRVNQALANPTEFVKNQQNVQDFSNWYSPQYGGPQNFEGSSIYSNLNNQVNQAVQNAGLTGTQGGLGTYMNNFLGANDWTEGMRVLDTALLQRNPQSRQAIQSAADPYKNLSSYLTDTTNKANQAIAGARGQVAQSQADVRGQTQAATDAFTQDLQNRVAQAKSGAQTNAEAFRAALGQGANLTQAERDLYGAGNWDDVLRYRDLLQNTQGPFSDTKAKYGEKFDFLPYLTEQNPESMYNMANVASADDYAREAALQQLTGNRFNVLSDDMTAAGTAPKTISQFNAQQAGQDLQQKLRDLDRQVIEQHGGLDLGSYSEQGWRDLLTDPRQAASYKSWADIINRNPDVADDRMRSVASRLQDFLSGGGTQGGDTGGGDAFQPGEPTDTSANLRIVDGNYKWYNGSQWVDAPPEYRNMVNGQYTERFNYDTGQYEPVGSGGGSGVIGFGGGTPGVY